MCHHVACVRCACACLYVEIVMTLSMKGPFVVIHLKRSQLNANHLLSQQRQQRQQRQQATYRWLSDWLNHAGPICRCNSTLVCCFGKHVNHVGCRCRSLPLLRELYSRCLRPALDEPGRPIPTGSSQGESGERRVVRILHSRDQTRPDQTRSEQIRCPCHHPEATTSIHHLSAQSVEYLDSCCFSHLQYPRLVGPDHHCHRHRHCRQSPTGSISKPPSSQPLSARIAPAANTNTNNTDTD